VPLQLKSNKIKFDICVFPLRNKEDSLSVKFCCCFYFLLNFDARQFVTWSKSGYEMLVYLYVPSTALTQIILFIFITFVYVAIRVFVA